MAQFTLVRDNFRTDDTTSDLYSGSEHLSEMVEDVRRLPGIKVQNETCIPAGCYRVAVSKSKRFKKLMPMLYNMSNGYEIRAEGIGFKGIRMHKGVTHAHTAGCLLYRTKGADQRVIDIITADASVGIESWIEIIDEV